MSRLHIADTIAGEAAQGAAARQVAPAISRTADGDSLIHPANVLLAGQYTHRSKPRQP